MLKHLEVLQTCDVETRHWSDVFTSTVGGYSGSEYLYRVKNKSEVMEKLLALGETHSDAEKLIDEYAKTT
jgi:hypothetical protein